MKMAMGEQIHSGGEGGRGSPRRVIVLEVRQGDRCPTQNPPKPSTSSPVVDRADPVAYTMYMEEVKFIFQKIGNGASVTWRKEEKRVEAPGISNGGPTVPGPKHACDVTAAHNQLFICRQPVYIQSVQYLGGEGGKAVSSCIHEVFFWRRKVAILSSSLGLTRFPKLVRHGRFFEALKSVILGV